MSIIEERWQNRLSDQTDAEGQRAGCFGAFECVGESETACTGSVARPFSKETAV